MPFPYGKDLLYQEDFMKKKFLFGLIALLSVSFIFFGCGGDSGADSSSNRIPISSITLAASGNPTGITISAEQDNDTGIYYVGVSGTVPAVYTYAADGTTAGTEPTNWDSATWGTALAPRAGKYASIKIAGIFDGTAPLVDTTEILGIKQTNQAFRFYTGNSDVNTPIEAGPIFTGDTLYVPADTAVPAYKWKGHPAGEFTSYGAFPVLIADIGVSPKTSTIVFRSHAAASNGEEPTDAVNVTIVVDYSGVTFTNTIDVSKSFTSAGSTGVTIASALKNTAGEITIALEGTPDTAYRYTVSEGVADVVGGSWDSATWGTALAPTAGKYASIKITGIIDGADRLVDTSKILGIKQTNQAFRFYTGNSDVNTPIEAGPNFTGDTLYVPANPAVPAYKWKGHGAGDLATYGAFPVLIADIGVSPKTSTIVFRSHAATTNGAAPTDDVNVTVVIDYSGVAW
jgi:hypothetical protein